MAQTAALNAGTVINDLSAGIQSWTNPGAAVGNSDATVASGNVTAANDTKRLTATNFGFTTADIPSGSTINGIIVDVRCTAASANRAFTEELSIVKGGTISGSNLGEGSASKWSTTISTRVYGSATELFGLTWLDTDIAGVSNFGVTVRCWGSNTSNVTVNWFSIVVDYSAPVVVSPPRIAVRSQAANRAASFMKRHSGIFVPRLWTPADGIA